MPEAILTILKFCFLALLYLFLLRVVRVVYLELGGARIPAGGGAATSTRRSGGRRRRGRGELHLKIVEPRETRGQTYDIDDEITLGRAATCQITLTDDNYVSQLHARVFRRDGDLFVEDLGSTNGTYLNRQRLTTEMPVQQGDRIQVGKTVLELSK